MQSYIRADQQIHILSQLIAKVNRSCLPALQDDSHTNLYFDPIEQMLYGRWFELHGERVISAIALPELRFDLIKPDRSRVVEISLSGKDLQDIEKEIEDAFSRLGGPGEGLLDPMHYEIPTYECSLVDQMALNSEGLREWVTYRTLANYACLDLMGMTQAASEIRIWPHHFDTGIYVEPNERMGIGFGLAMQDGMVDTPYFYLSAYPKTSDLNYEKAPVSAYWTWHTTDAWKGCVLPLSNITDESLEIGSGKVHEYLAVNTNWILTQA